MKEKFLVKIVCEKNGRLQVFENEAEDMKNVVRMILTFKPKRGYEVFHVTIDKVEGIV